MKANYNRLYRCTRAHKLVLSVAQVEDMQDMFYIMQKYSGFP